jgi:hypothetical protein
MTAEELNAIRANNTHRQSMLRYEIMPSEYLTAVNEVDALLAHIDAVGEAPKAPVVTDAMVERAARAMYESSGMPSRWGDLLVQELYRITARRVLTAALAEGMEPTTNRGHHEQT